MLNRCLLNFHIFLCKQLEIVNARNLVPVSSTCDPFVRIQFSPEDKIDFGMRYRTTVQNKTLFPLYDEKFLM